MRKSRFGPVFEGKKKEEMAEDVRSSWRKMKRIVIKMESGGGLGSRGHLERLHITGVPTHSGIKGKLFRKRDNRPATKTLRDCSQRENVHRDRRK